MIIKIILSFRYLQTMQAVPSLDFLMQWADVGWGPTAYISDCFPGLLCSPLGALLHWDGTLGSRSAGVACFFLVVGIPLRWGSLDHRPVIKLVVY